jgi:Ala-tRNA(Pro) deacylase
MLKQGKLSLASDRRLEQWLGLTPGSVTPFGLINDETNHIHLFIDSNLKNAEKLSFHPCINTATLVINGEDFLKFLDWTGNSYEYIELY